MRPVPTASFASGTGILRWTRAGHRQEEEASIEFADGSVRGQAADARLEGRYDKNTGLFNWARTELSSGAIEHWDGVSDGSALWGTVRGILPEPEEDPGAPLSLGRFRAVRDIR